MNYIKCLTTLFLYILYLPCSHGFRHIDLSNNPLGEGGARELAEAVRKTFTVKSLKLRCCQINEAGIKYLHSALAINQSIKYLDIEGNDISAVSVYTALVSVLFVFLFIMCMFDSNIARVFFASIALICTVHFTNSIFSQCNYSQAEVQAANDVEALREDPQAVDANSLTVYVSHIKLLYQDVYCLLWPYM